MLSTRNSELLDLLRSGALPQRPELTLPRLVPYLRTDYKAFSIWPIFVDADECQRQVGPLVANIPRIFYAALRARFGRDSAAFAAYFKLPALLYELMLSYPVDSRDVFARYDAVWDGDALKLIELNAGTSAGGWQYGDWLRPSLRELFGHAPRSAHWEVAGDTAVDRLFDLLIDTMRRRNGARRGGHVLMYSFAQTDDERDALRRYLQLIYDRRKPTGWPDGKIFLFSVFDEITFPADGDVCFEGHRMDAVALAFPPVEGIPDVVSDSLFSAYLRGRVAFPDSALHMTLGDKRLFALVHECCRDGLLDAADRALIERHVPWTGLLDVGMAASDVIIRQREQWVLKRAESFGGQHVVVGRETDAQEWADAVARHAREDGWIVQRYCPPGRLELHDNLHGIAEYELIWGLFAAGRNYGGATVRGSRTDNTCGVINSMNGATLFLVLDAAARGPAISTELAAATAALSPLNLRLVSTLSPADAQHGGHPATDTAELPHFVRDHVTPVSRWPVFITEALIRSEIDPLVTALPDTLFNAILARFHGDPEGFSRYFGQPRELFEQLVRRRPDPRDLLIRYDAVINADGTQVLGIDACSPLGGWQLDWLAPVALAALQENERFRDRFIVHRPVVEHLLRQVFGAMDRLGHAASGQVLVQVGPARGASWLDSAQRSLQDVCDRVRPPHYPAARIVVGTQPDDIEFAADGVYHAGVRVDAILLPFAVEDPLADALCDRIAEASRRGHVVSADTHLQRLISDTRLFALLHECLQECLLAPRDAALVERYIPWSVRVVSGSVDWKGENASLSALLRRRRTSLVLKQSGTPAGRNVIVGRATAAADWAAAVEHALADGDWIAQEHCAPARQLVCAPGAGVAAQDLVWGLFAFGGRYAGAFVRGSRADTGTGTTNAGHGSAEFIVLEDRGESPSDDGYSRLNGRLLDALANDPAMRAERLDIDDADTVQFLRGSGLKIGTWPLFVDPDFARRRFTTIVEAVPGILYKAITAYFGDDAGAFSGYFGMPALVYELLRHAPVDPRDLNARYDVSVTADSVRILEVNCSSAAGGFQLDWVEPKTTRLLRRHPATAQWPVQRHAVFRTQLQVLIASMLRRKPRRATGHVLMYAFAGEAAIPSLQAAFQAAYDEIMPPELSGARIHLFTDFSTLGFDRAGNVLHAGVVIDAVLFTFPNLVDVPEDVYRRLTEAYLAGRLVFPDSPLHLLLDTKMQLALVHECCERGLLDARERAIVRDTIPWTAMLRERDVEWNDERLPLSRLLLRERERFVLKKATSFGGRDVVVGRHCTPDEWAALLSQYLDDRSWLAQEYCPPGRVRLYDPDLGVCDHDLVWGVFTFGGRYGGAFLRGKPSHSTNGVINTASGAVELLVYDEIDPAPEKP